MAHEATLLDPTYVKAYCRLGQGLAKQNENTKALEAYEETAVWEPSNLAVAKEIEDMKLQLAEKKALLDSIAKAESMDIDKSEAEAVR